MCVWRGGGGGGLSEKLTSALFLRTLLETRQVRMSRLFQYGSIVAGKYGFAHQLIA